MTGRERLEWLKRGHMPLVQALFDEAYACGHKDGRADGEAVIGMLEAQKKAMRLEWDDGRLILRMDDASFVVATYFIPELTMLIRVDDSPVRVFDSEADLLSAIAEWCAAHLPSLRFPPFPGAAGL